MPTPGHTFGHVSFFRQQNKALVAGDAFTTVFAESALDTLTQKQEVHGPPAYFTPDWDAARASMELLARLEPEVAATGHGIAMHGEELRRQLAAFVPRFDALARSSTGRYVRQPATADGHGVTSVPPPLVQPWLKGLAAVGVAIGVLALLAGRKKNCKNCGKIGKPHNKNKAGRHGPPAGTYRAAYRDSPAEYQAGNHASYEPHLPQPPQHNRAPGESNGDHRYSEQQVRKIGTQYP